MRRKYRKETHYEVDHNRSFAKAQDDKVDKKIISTSSNINARKVKILMTGGHAATTALAFIKYLRKKSPNWEIVWVGSKNAFEGKDVPSFEAINFEKENVRLVHLVTGKIRTKFSLISLASILKIPVGFLSAIKILNKEKPDVIFSFGGFAAFPVIVSGWLLNVPVVIHEQTAAVGRANKYSQFFAKKILLSRKESLDYFDKKKSEIVGLPLGDDILQLSKKTHKKNPTRLFIAGGSRGSQIINRSVLECLDVLKKEFEIVHVTGILDYQKHKKSEDKNYKVYSVVEPQKIADFFQNSDIFVSRSGANMVAEAMYVGIPSVFVPLPFAYQNEQYKNADLAKKHGLAEILPQANLNSDSLYKLIKKAENNWQKTVNGYKYPYEDELASHKMYKALKNLL